MALRKGAGPRLGRVGPERDGDSDGSDRRRTETQTGKGQRLGQVKDRDSDRRGTETRTGEGRRLGQERDRDSDGDSDRRRTETRTGRERQLGQVRGGDSDRSGTEKRTDEGPKPGQVKDGDSNRKGTATRTGEVRRIRQVRNGDSDSGGMETRTGVGQRPGKERDGDSDRRGTETRTGEGGRPGHERDRDSDRSGTVTRTHDGRRLGQTSPQERDGNVDSASDLTATRIPGIREGLVSDRIREWSSRDHSTEETAAVQWGPGGIVLCRGTFEGMRGRVSEHIPTVRRSERDKMRRRHRYSEYLKSLHPTAPPPHQPETEQPAASSALPPNEWTEPERLQLTVELGDRTIVVQAEESDWEWATRKGSREVSGAWAVEWTVATALQRALGPTVRTQPLPVQPVLNGMRVQAWLEPFSWESLTKFARIGGQYRVTTLLRGGTPLGAAHQEA